MRINNVGGSNSVYYILKDHLGSASVITNDQGVEVGTERYYPYGETRFTSGTINTDKLFTRWVECATGAIETGQRDVGLGIYHYGARFYSPKLGRFLSADTIVPGAANPQAYNRYSYVLGNPLKYIDPTGHYCVGDDEDCADEAGYGPAPSGNGGGNNGGGGGGGGGGNPHDEERLPDPNPTGFVSPPVCSSLICDPSFTGPYPPIDTPHSPEPNPVISIVGAVLLLQLTVVDLALAVGIIALAGAGPIGWVVDAFALIPLEFASLNLSIYAAQMAYYGTTDHDVLPMLHGLNPDILPYTP